MAHAARLYQSGCPPNCSCYPWTFKPSKALWPSKPATKPGALVMSSIPLDLERRCEQRWAASFSAARALHEQHRLDINNSSCPTTAKEKPAALTRRTRGLSLSADVSRRAH